MKKNNALILLPTDIIGGAERVAKNLVSYLASQNINVTILFLAKGKSGGWEDLEFINNVDIIYNNSNSESEGVIRCLTWLLVNNEISFDYVFSTHVHINFFIAVLRRLKILTATKHIARESTVIFDRFYGSKRILLKCLYKFYGNIELLIFQTDYMKNRLLKEVTLINNLNFKVIKNPLNFDLIRSSVTHAETPTRSSSSQFNILFVGRIVKIKNLPVLIYALKNCIDAGIVNVKLDVVGDGDLKEEISDLANQLGISKYIVFHGNIQNPYMLMSKADLGVITSLKEGFPNVLIEMMASGTKNIITTPCAGDLSLLPDVSVMKGFTSEELALQLKNFVKYPIDNSNSYFGYAKQLDISNFWRNVIRSL